MAAKPERPDAGTPEVQLTDKLRPIIVVRKKKAGHGEHHSGAWKVAYADFVTAMMALFIVLWLMSSDQEVKEAIAQYFRNPTGPGRQSGTAAPGVGKALELARQDMEKLKEKITEALKAVPKFESLKDHVEMTITPDGLRIELLETDAGMFFESGKGTPTEVGGELLKKLAEELGKLPNGILLEGHTDAKPFGSGNGFTNWELSSDRANSARSLMEANGLRHDQVSQVRGFADRQLRHPDNPEAASNRRVSVIVQYLPTDNAGTAAKQEAAKAPDKTTK
jgi:chemotaxis protein MotB